MSDLILRNCTCQRRLIAQAQRIGLLVTHDNALVLKIEYLVHIDEYAAVDIEKIRIWLKQIADLGKG